MDTIKNFYAQPWKGAQNMTALDWFLIFGLFILISGLWRIVLSHIEA